MKWSDIPRNPTNRTLRQFAAAWLVFFLIWGGVQAFYLGRIKLGSALAAVAVVGGLGGLIRPSLLGWIFVGWMMLAFPIGWLVSHIMLVILFYVFFVPLAIFLRLRGHDALGLKPSADQKSFWLRKETPLDIRSYFRQY